MTLLMIDVENLLNHLHELFGRVAINLLLKLFVYVRLNELCPFVEDSSVRKLIFF